jgi:adenylate cyclase
LSTDDVERKLAAILSADVVGYSRLMAEDETGTIRTLRDYREAIAMLVRQHRGRVVDSPGDNLLAEFPTALDAVSCAVETQAVLKVRNTHVPPARRMEFRIGVHLGDVVVEEERVYGDGVNIAARLEGLAEPGGVCLSATVHDQVRNRLAVDYQDLGDQAIKNIPDLVRVYQVRAAERSALPGVARSQRPKSSRLRTAALATGAAVVLLGVGIWVSWPYLVGVALSMAGLSGETMNPSLPEVPSIAVLPFANLSGDPEQEYFSDGITEDLTTDLSRNPYLFVISRNSAFTYKGKNTKVEDVGRELGVRYVLEGSVRKAEDRVRITAQLIDATTGFHVWSERYDRDLADIFALQSEVSEQILAALQVEIPAAELARIRQKPTDNLTAYDLFQQALAHFNRYTRDDVLKARGLLERTVELDPSYATAYSLLGATYTVEFGFGWDLDPAILDRGEELAQRALALDPSIPTPHTSLAAVNLFRRRPDISVAEAETAIEIAPNIEASHFFLGMAKAQQGKFVAATRAINRAQRLNPRAPSGLSLIVPYVNLAAGREAEAVEMLERLRIANPDLIGARIPLAAIYQADGRHDDARVLAEEILRVNPDMTAEAATGMFSDSLLGEDAALDWTDALRGAGLP